MKSVILAKVKKIYNTFFMPSDFSSRHLFERRLREARNMNMHTHVRDTHVLVPRKCFENEK